MSIAMALYVGESSFSSLEKVTEHTKSMIESWTVTNNESVKNVIDFNPALPNFGYNGRRESTSANREDYAKYGWLFGGR
jgi:hypothetical protein